MMMMNRFCPHVNQLLHICLRQLNGNVKDLNFRHFITNSTPLDRKTIARNITVKMTIPD